MAAKRYLLDTNILSDLIPNPSGRVAEEIRRVGEEAVWTGIVVAAESRRHAETRIEASQYAGGCSAGSVGGSSVGSSMRTPLRRDSPHTRTGGNSVGGNDLLIAAHALELGLTLVTR
jgi:tRNA(fMet)-specific endonuclease VapC